MNIGGGLLTLSQLATNLAITQGMIGYVKAESTYSISTGVTFSGAGSNTVNNRVIGYTTSRGDLGQPEIQATAAITAVTISGGSFSFENFIIDGDTATATNGLVISTASSASNILVRNFSAYCIEATLGNSSSIINSTVTGCGTAGVYGNGSGLVLDSDYIYSNTGPGVYCNYSGGNVCVITHSIIAGNSTYGLQIGSRAYGIVTNSVFYNNGADGIRAIDYIVPEGIIPVTNCIFESNGQTSGTGYAINFPSATAMVAPYLHHNAFYNNKTGTYGGITGGVNNVTLSGDPFVSTAATLRQTQHLEPVR